MTDLMEQSRYTLATEGDLAFLIAADSFDDSNDPENVRFGQLLRRYIEIQTYVRMSQPIPVEMADSFKKLNDSFTVVNPEYRYSEQFGPFFLRLSTSQTNLVANLNWLVEQPIRELVMTDMRTGGDLNLIFRNHRFQSLKRVTLRPDYRMRDVAGVAGAIRQMTAYSLLSLSIEYGLNDRLGLIKSAFASNRTIPKGAELFLQRNRVWVKK